MQPDQKSLEQTYDSSAYGTGLESEMSQVIAPDVAAASVRADAQASPFRTNKLALWVTISATLLILIVGAATFFLGGSHNDKNSSGNGVKAANYAVSTLSVGNAKADTQLQVGEADHLAINGQLRVSNTLVLGPTSRPTAPTVGQIYYDQTTNEPYYFNGTAFVSLAPVAVAQHVTAIGGAAGVISLGSGLEINGNQLSVASSLLQAVASASASAPVETPRVTSLQGLTGDVTLTAGPGISISGTTISSTGVNSLTSSDGSIVISPNGSGGYDIVTVQGGPGSQAILLAPAGAQPDSSTRASLALNKTGSGNIVELQNNGTNTFVINQSGQITSGTINYSQVQGRPTSVVTDIAGATGTVSLGSGLGLSGNTLSNTGVVSISGTTNQVIASASSGSLTLSLPQSIGTTSTPVFGGETLNGQLTVSTGGVSITAGGLTVAAGGANVTGATAINGNLSVSGANTLTTGTGTVTFGSLGAGLLQANAFGVLSSGAVDRNSTTLLTGTLNVGNGGTGATVFNANGILYGGTGGTGALKSTTSANGAVLATDPATGIPSLVTTLPSTVQGNITTTGILTSGSINTGFGTINTGNNITTTAALQGATLTVAGGNFTVDASGNVVTKGAASIQGAGGLTLGVTGTRNGSLVFANSNGHITTLQGLAQTGQDQTITIPASNVATDTVCLLSLANCVGTGGGVTASGGTQNFLPKFTNAAGTQIGNSLIFDNGTSIGIGTSSPGASYKLDVNGNTHVTGSATITSGLTVTGNSTINGTLTSLTGLTSSGTITFSGLGAGVVRSNSSGVLTTGTVTLGTDTTGDYVANIGTLTGLSTSGNSGAGSTPTLSVIYGNTASSAVEGNKQLTVSAGTGLSGGGTVTLGTGGTATLSVQYGSSSGTAVQGNTTLVCAAGSGNLSGGGNTITLGAAGNSCGNISITNSPTFSGDLSVQGANGITVGVAGTTAGIIKLANGSNTNLGSLITDVLGQATTFTLPDPHAASAEICLSTGNCAGAGGGITGTGTSGQLAVFTGSGTLGSSSLSDVSGTVTASGNLVIQGANSLTLGTSNSANGSVAFRNALGGHTVTLQAPATDPAADLVFKLPSAYGANGDCLKSNGAGVLSFTSCTGGAGGGVTSVNGESGVLTVANASGSGGTITIDDASTSAKGIAQFNNSDFSVVGGVVDTIQGITNTSAVQFGSLNLGTGDLTLSATGTINANNIKNVGTNDLTFDATNNAIIFKTENGSSTFIFPTGGGQGQVICTTGVTCAAGGGQAVVLEPNAVQTASANKTSIFINKSNTGVGAGNILQLQSQGTDALIVDNTGATTVKSLTVNNTLTVNTITPTSSLTVGATTQKFTLQGTGASVITATGGGTTTTVGFNIGSGGTAPNGAVSYTFRNDNTVAAGTYEICTSSGNCVGAGGGVTTTGGTTGKLARFTGSNTIGDSLISDNGTLVTIGGNLSVTGSSTFTGLITANGGLTVANNSNFSQTGSGTFSTGTGAVTLNGNTSISGTNTLTVGSGASVFGGTVDVTGLATLGGGATISGATTITGAANINTSGTASTAIGNATGSFSLASSGLNVTTAGALSGITTLSASGAISAATSGNTINGLVISSGALSGITGYAQSSGNFVQTGTGTFSTGTGAVSLNGNTTVAGNLNVQGSGGLTLGVANTTEGILKIAHAGTTNLSQIQFGVPSGTGDATYTLPGIAGGTSDQICLVGAGNCAGSGTGVTASGGTTNYISKFTTGQNITSSQLFDNGSFVGVNTTTNSGQLSVVASSTQSGLYIQGAATGSSPVSVIRGGGSTGDLLQIQNSGGTPIAKIDASGNLSAVSLTTTGNASVGGTVTVGTMGVGLVQSSSGGLLSSGTVNRDSSSFFTGTLSVGNGGTGAASFTANGILFGSGASALQVATGTAGQFLQLNASGVPTLTTLSGDASISSSGALTVNKLQTKSLTFSGLAVGHVIQYDGTGFVNGLLTNTNLQSGSFSNITGTGILTSGSIDSGFGAINTTNAISTTADITGANVNATGTLELNGVNINDAGTLSHVAYLNQDNTFTGTISVQGAGGLTVGTSSQQGLLILAAGNGNNGTLQIANSTGQNTVYTLPDPGQGTATICLSTGNCAGSGGGITGSGTNGKLVKFTGSGSVADSTLSESGSTLTASGNMVIQGANSLGLGLANSHNGSIIFSNSSNANTTTLQSSSSAISSLTFTLPASAGSPNQCLVTDGSGVLSFATCLSGSGAGGGVTSLDSFVGAVTVQGTTNQVSVLDAGNTITLSLPQDIASSSSPTFTNLSLQGSTGLTLGSTTNIGRVAFKDGTSDGFTTAFTPTTLTASRSIIIPDAAGTLAVSASGNIKLDTHGNITFSGTLPIASGGTGASSATSARGNLGAAASGTNSDITSLTGITSIGNATSALTVGDTAQALTLQGAATSTISVVSGGFTTTVGFTAPTANRTITFPDAGGTVCLSSNNCSFAASNAVVSSLQGLTGAVTINNVTTSGNAITINDASTSAKGIAQFNSTNFTVASGVVNTVQDIASTASPSFAGLTLGTALTVANGGTGQGSFTANGLIFGNNTSGLQVTAAGTAGQILIAGVGGVPIFTTLAGDASITSGGSLTVNKLQNNTLTIATPTTGQVLQYNGTAFVNGMITDTNLQTGTFTHITGTGILAAGSIASGFGTISTGNTITTTSTVTGATVNATGTLQLGGADINAAGTLSHVAYLNQDNIFSGTLTVQAAGGLTIGTGSQQGILNLAAGNGKTGVLQAFSTLGQNTTYTLPDPGQSTATICLSTGNCAGSGGGVTTTGGTNGKIAKFTGSGTIADSTLSESGSTVTASGNLVIQGANSLTLGTSSSADGSIIFKTAAGGHSVTLQAPASNPAADIVFKLPSADGAANQCLTTNGSGQLAFAACLSGSGGSGGGVSSLQGLSGAVTLNNVTTSGNAITIDDASTTVKGIAQFNGTNFTVASGVVNTAQDIASTSSPTFAGLTLSTALSVANGGTGATGASGARTNLGAAASGANSDITSLTGATSISNALGALTIGNTGQSLLLQGGGSSTLQIAAGGNTTTVNFAAPTTNRTITFPDADGTVCLSTNNCGFALGGGGGVTSLQGLTGVITMNNITTSGNAITINDASTSAKGIAQFTTGDFSVASGVVSLGANVAKLDASQTFTGANTFKNTTDSTAAFQVQNAAGGNLFNIDSANSNITINGANAGNIQSWQTASGAGFSPVDSYGSVVANGYMYIIGGVPGASGATSSTVQYAKVSANGDVGTWGTTSSLPGGRSNAPAVVANGYIYVVGGLATVNTASSAQSTVYYAKIKADGTLGSWATSANPLNVSGAIKRYSHTSITANGYLYVIGGSDATGTAQNTVYYSKLNADGSNGAWTTTNTLWAAESRHSTAVANGYVYALGGDSGLVATQYAKLNSDGTTGVWASAGASLPGSRINAGIAIENGYIYEFGGDNASGTRYASTFFAPLNSNGTIGAWSCQGSAGNCGTATPINGIAMPATNNGYASTPVSANGYFYAPGGYSGTAQQGTIFYTSTARIKVNGSLDLVGDSGENLADGGSGGELTAGNTTIVGSLNVRGQANFAQGVSISDALSVGGAANFKNTNNAATAFQIQNAGGVNNFNVTTVNLVGNASMESGPINVDGAVDGWVKKLGSETSLKTQASNAMFGSNSMELVTTTTAQQGVKYPVSLAASTQYTFSFYAKVSTGSFSTMRFGRSDTGASGGETNCVTNGALATTYARYTCTFTTGSTMGASGTPYIFISKGTDTSIRTIYIDGVQLETGAAATNYREADIKLDGQITIKNSADSTTAFQIQNAAGSNIFQVDSVNSKVIINGANTGETTAWTTASNALPVARSYSSPVTANGYAYIVGGYNSAGTATNSVLYAKLNADGSMGTWKCQGTTVAASCGVGATNVTNGNVLPAARAAMSVVVLNGYIYAISGFDGTNPQQAVYHAKLNADGSTGAWTAAGFDANLTSARFSAASTVVNGYIYIFGGNNGGRQSDIYYAKPGLDGKISSWTTSATQTTGGVGVDGQNVVTDNGYIYTFAGAPSNDVTDNGRRVSYTRPNADGSLPAWTEQDFAIPVGKYDAGAVAVNGYLYMYGGSTSPSGADITSTVYYTKLNGDGSPSAPWLLSNNTLPQSRYTMGQKGITANGYIYAIGGGNATNQEQSTVYYTSVARTQIAGSLDLVGVNGQNLADGGTGGELTAGNTSIIGTLSVRGAASVGQALTVKDSLTVGGSALFQNSTDSTAAFQVQNAAGNSLLNVDTTNSSITLNNNYTGSISPWQTSANSLPLLRSTYASVIANGYVYVMGGTNGSTAQTTVYSAKIQSNGNVGTWSTLSSTPLPVARSGAAAAYANGYVYVTAGDNGTNAQQTVFFARVNQDGTLGSWSCQGAATAQSCGTSGTNLANTNIMATKTTNHGTAIVNGYIYVIGGDNAPGGAHQSAVQYAKLNADGSTGAWVTNGTPLGATTSYDAVSTNNGYIYINTGNGGIIAYGKPAADGSIASWSSNTLPTNRVASQMAITNNYIYLVGGTSTVSGSPTYTGTVYAPLNSDGSIGTWLCQGASGDCTGFTQTNTTALPAVRGYATDNALTYDGYIYEIGGQNGSVTSQTSVYYTSVARTQIAGSFDVANTATFMQGLTSNGTLTVNGSAVFQNSTNSTTAFQIQNAAGSTFFNADTANKIITTGDLNVGSPSNVGGSGHLFSDSFESGNFNQWNASPVTAGSSTATVDSTIKRNGKYSAKFVVNGGLSYLAQPITSTTGAITARANVYVASQSADTSFFTVGNSTDTFDYAISRQSSTGYLCFYDGGAAGGLTCSTTVMTTGAWHKIELYTNSVNTGNSDQLYLDGVLVLSTPVLSASNAFNKVWLGNAWNTGASTFYVDDFAVDTVATGDSASLNVSDNLHVSGSSSFGGNLLVQPVSNSTGTFQVQNASGTELLNIDSTNSNIITNGSFEGTNGTAGWLKYSNSETAFGISSSQAYIGSNSLTFTSTASADRGVKYPLTTTTLASKSTYTLTVSVKMQADSQSENAGFGIGRSEDGSTDIACLTNQTTTSGGWKTFTCQFTTGTTSGTPYIYLKQTDGDAARTYFIDGVQLIKDSMLANSSMESSISGNWTAKGSPSLHATTTLNAHDGASSLRVQTSGVADQGTKQNITLADSTTYTLSFYGETGSGTWGALAAGYSSNGTTDNTSCMANQILDYYSGWTNYTCTFTTPASHSGTPYIYIKNSAATANIFFIDQVRLAQGSSVPLGGAYRESSITLNGTVTSPAVFQNQTDSTTAFQIQNAAGRSLFVADTSANWITVNGGLTVNQGGGLQGISSNWSGLTAGWTFTNQAGLVSSISQTDSTTGGLSLCASTTSSDCSAGAGQLRISAGGATTLQNSTNSTAAFQVQNASGTSILQVDTTTDSTNLVTNGSYETDTSGWAAKTVSGTSALTRVTAQSYTGSAAMQIATTGTATNNGATYAATLSNSTQYTLSFYAKLSSGTMADLKAGYSSTGAAGGETACTLNATTVVTNGWTRYICTFTTPGSHSGTPYIFITQSAATGHAYFVDGVRLETGASAGAYREGAILLNGAITTPVALKNATNSTTALLVQDASGNTLLGVDTLNSTTSINTTTATGTGLAVTANSLTTGNGLSVSTTSNLTSGNLAVISQASTFTSTSTESGSLLNISRNITSNISGGTPVTLGNTGQGGIGSGSSSGNMSMSISSQSNQVFLFGIYQDGGPSNTVATATYDGTPMTLVGSTWSSGGDRVDVYRWVSPSSGSHTIHVANVTGTNGAFFLGVTYYNVDLTNFGAAAGASQTNNTAAVSIPTTTGADKVIAMGNNGIIGGSETPVSSGTFANEVTVANGTGGNVTLSRGIGSGTNAIVAMDLKPSSMPTTNVTGAVANFTNTCTTPGTSSCNDTSAVLNLNQSYGGASGPVLNIQNSGHGADIQIGSTTTGLIQTAAGLTSNGINIFSGNASSGASGDITIDTGTHTAGIPSVNLGTTNASIVNIGNASSTINLNGSVVNFAGYTMGIDNSACWGTFDALCWSQGGVGLMSLDQSGDLTALGFIGQGNPDIAEKINAASDVQVYDVVSADPANDAQAIRTTGAYDPAVIGVMSDGTSTFQISSKSSPNGKLMVLAGRVPVHATNENGPIKRGDYLTASSTPGYVMKATHAGATIGKALADFDDASGTVMTQVAMGYYGGPSSSDFIQNGGAANIASLIVGGSANFSTINTSSNVNIGGDLTVAGAATFQSLLVVGPANFQGDITINGHIITAGDTPSAAVQAAAGAGATVVIDGNDTSGTITITSGTTPAAGDIVKIIFSKSYSKAPHLVFSPSNEDATDLNLFKGTTSATDMILRAKSVPGNNKTYIYDYFIAQ